MSGDAIGWVVLAMVLAWVGFTMYEGYRRETAPPLPMADNGHGMREPVCPTCQARLVTVTRSARGPVAGLLGWGVIAGAMLAMLFSWLAGLLLLLLGVVVLLAGKTQATVLMCPACRADVRSLD